MTGTIATVEKTATKYLGTIVVDGGEVLVFEQPLTHLDDRDRGFEVGHTVTFRMHRGFPALAFDVEVASA